VGVSLCARTVLQGKVSQRDIRKFGIQKNETQKNGKKLGFPNIVLNFKFQISNFELSIFVQDCAGHQDFRNSKVHNFVKFRTPKKYTKIQKIKNSKFQNFKISNFHIFKIIEQFILERAFPPCIRFCRSLLAERTATLRSVLF
jgi:hypothetical protein